MKLVVILDEFSLTPAQHSQPINHGSVRVRSHQTVRIVVTIPLKHHPGQVFQIDLMDYSWARRNDPHVLECFRTPLWTNTISSQAIFIIISCSLKQHQICQKQKGKLPLKTQIVLCSFQIQGLGFSEGCQTLKNGKGNKLLYWTVKIMIRLSPENKLQDKRFKWHFSCSFHV